MTRPAHGTARLPVGPGEPHRYEVVSASGHQTVYLTPAEYAEQWSFLDHRAATATPLYRRDDVVAEVLDMVERRLVADIEADRATAMTGVPPVALAPA